MKLTLRCPNCGTSSSLAEEYLGHRVKCPFCRARFKPKGSAEVHQTHTPALESTRRARSGKRSIGNPARTDYRFQKLGRFEIREQLGAGGFGTVYRAYDPQLDRDVALKVPHTTVMENPDTVKRFLREVKTAAQLRHPHIVPIYDAGRDGEHYYLAAAFIEGRTLAESLAEGPLQFREAAKIVFKLAEALAYAHSQGIIHRDVKPSNVMLSTSLSPPFQGAAVSEEGGNSTAEPHLMDFGLARLQTSTEKLTQDGSKLGTPAYMSPEQARGEVEEITSASDQYSLGVVLYELLTGQTPFSGPPQIVLFNVLEQEPPRPRNINPRLPRDLETICLKAMAKDAASRYQTCQEFAKDLSAFLAGKPIHARRVGRVERSIRWCRRNPLTASVAFALAVLIAVTTVLGTQLVSNRATHSIGRVDSQRASQQSEATDSLTASRSFGDFPELKEVDPSWNPIPEAEASRILENRNAVLANLENHRWSDIYDGMQAAVNDFMQNVQLRNRNGNNPNQGPRGGMIRPPPARLNLPGRFVVTGRLAGVRSYYGGTLIALAAPANAAGIGPGPPPYCLIEFPGPPLTAHLADYAVGATINAVVRRKEWGDGETPPPPLHELKREWRVSPLALSSPAGPMGPVRIWCLLGEALETLDQPDTWVSLENGRTAKLANLDELKRSPGFLCRHSQFPKGTFQVTAVFQGLQQTGKTRRVELHLPKTVEGTVIIRADLTDQMLSGEFADYAEGDLVEGLVMIKPMRSPDDPHRFGLTPPIFYADLKQVRKRDDASTLITASGPRRSLGE